MNQYKILKLFFLAGLFALTGCLGGNRPTSGLGGSDGIIGGELTPGIIANRCVRHEFQQGQDDHLYGRDCIEGKEIKIKTAAGGDLISIMSVDGGAENVIIEEGIDFISHVYDLDYSILESEGDDSKISFLLDFAGEGEDFKGMPDQEYSLVFKTNGNYLIIYKASEDVNNIPYGERSSMIEEKINGRPLYMAPFLGYPVQYCQAQAIRNSQQEITRLARAKCEDEPSGDTPYLRLRAGQKQVFQYVDKQNVFPSEYFEGEWFFAYTQIDSSTEGELDFADSNLVVLKKGLESFIVLDNSNSKLKEINRARLYELPISWLEVELDQENNTFSKFGERLNNDKTPLRRPQLQVNFHQVKDAGSIEQVLISPDYFSFIYLNNAGDQTRKMKISLLRKSYIPSGQFKAKRWFARERDRVFSLLRTIPQLQLKSLNLSEGDLHKEIRVLKFDTGLYTTDEKAEKTKTINWYFSKNSTKEEHYRAVAREAMAVYNRAFEIIADGEDPKIQFQLVEREKKQLGDMRYNIINLIKIEDLAAARSGLLGFAPSHSNPETGQIISGVSNIAIHSLEESFVKLIRDYTRYEIFQSHKSSEEENKVHVVSDYIRWKIQTECPELEAFIAKKRGVYSDYRTKIKDFELIQACAVKVSRPALLQLILHEMGHNCSKGHNFECSNDKVNFYKDLDEIKKYFPNADLSDLEALEKTGDHYSIPKSSCVMDYFNHQALPLPVLGKNDLMVLRYVYEDELELAGHKWGESKVQPIEFNYTDVEQQVSLTENKELMDKRNPYRYCTDEHPIILYGRQINPEGRLGCAMFDYGADYKEIVENYFLKLKRALKSRYTYDLAENLINSNSPRLIDAPWQIVLMNLYHNKWLELRDNFLQKEGKIEFLTYDLTDPINVTAYKEAIDPKNNEEKFNQEYKDYYPIAEIYTKAIKLALFQRPMRCLVEETESGVAAEINLNYLVSQMKADPDYEDILYVIDCYSPHVVDFLDKNGLDLTGQDGVQDFAFEKSIYGTYAVLDEENKKADIIPLRYINGLLPSARSNPLYSNSTINSLLNPDFHKEISIKVQENGLDIDQYVNDFEIIRNTHLLLSMKNYLPSDGKLKNSAEYIKIYQQQISFLVHDLGTGGESFYQQIEEPLKEGRSIESFESSFLTELYNEYRNTSYNSFEDYIKSRKDDDVVVVAQPNNNDTLYIPYHKDSWSYKLAVKYNELMKELAALEKRSDLTLLEKYHKLKLERFKAYSFGG